MKYPMHLTVGFVLRVLRGQGPVKPEELFLAPPDASEVAALEAADPETLMPCRNHDCANAGKHFGEAQS